VSRSSDGEHKITFSVACYSKILAVMNSFVVPDIALTIIEVL
jgi:hypothetical protein